MSSRHPAHFTLFVGLFVASACEREHKLVTEVLEPSYRGFQIESYDEKAVQPGTVFFTDGSNQAAPRIVEVDRTGKVVWQWVVPTDLLNANTVMDTAPMPDGGALVIVDAIGVVQVTEDGQVARIYESMLPSHDVDLLDDGSWLVTNGWVQKGEPHFMEVAPDDSVVWSWDGLDRYDVAPYNEVYREGWVHANAAERLDDGNTLVSLRNFNIVALLDEAGTTQWEIGFSDIEPEAAAAGLYDVAYGSNPHDPELTIDGTLLVAVHRPSVVLEIDLDSRAVIWSWSPEVDSAGKIRDANRLPNGNTLITSTRSVLEVDAAGTVVWQLFADESLFGQDAPEEFRPFYKACLIAPDGTVYGG
ncbi:MAG: hypothetical protein CL927_16450 [Deltaproteobacteria bacterium]|nr:hypothetical protein [Deltaproteobacteria bacterium]HCH65729.1 hypothetical protein [Deltaproteobacteria bacterium]